MSENCYFFPDHRQPEDERCMAAMCIECRKDHPEIGWFWQGELRGYGPYDIICTFCKRVIHAANQGATQNDSPTSI